MWNDDFWLLNDNDFYPWYRRIWFSKRWLIGRMQLIQAEMDRLIDVQLEVENRNADAYLEFLKREGRHNV